MLFERRQKNEKHSKERNTHEEVLTYDNESISTTVNNKIKKQMYCV
jgi:hypothetical protein